MESNYDLKDYDKVTVDSLIINEGGCTDGFEGCDTTN